MRLQSPVSILLRMSFHFTVCRLDVGMRHRPRGLCLARQHMLQSSCYRPVPENLFDLVSEQKNVSACKSCPPALQPSGEVSADQLGWFVIPAGFGGWKPGLVSSCPAVGHSWELESWGQGGRIRRKCCGHCGSRARAWRLQAALGLNPASPLTRSCCPTRLF